LQHRLDDGVPCGQSGSDAMAAVAHDVDVALTYETDRRGLAALLEPLSVPLDRRLADAAAATVTDPNLDKGSPDGRGEAFVLAHAPSLRLDWPLVDDLKLGRLEADVVPDLPDRTTRLDAPRVHQRAPPIDVAAESLDRPSRAVERDHQLHPQLLAEWEPADQSLELGHERRSGSKFQLCGQQLLQRIDAKLLETTDLALCELLVTDVHQRRAAPEPERLVEQANLLNDTRAAGSVEQSLEAERIDAVLGNGKDIAAVGRLEHVAAECATQTRDHVVERRSCRRRSTVAPQVVDQLIGGAKLARMQKQGQDERPKQLASQRAHTISIDYLERAEDAELESDRARPAPATR
jgi:hypothetical protein